MERESVCIRVFTTSCVGVRRTPTSKGRYATFVTFVIFVADVFVGVVAGPNARPFPTLNGG